MAVVMTVAVMVNGCAWRQDVDTLRVRVYALEQSTDELSRQVEDQRARLDFIRANVSGRTSQLELLRELTDIIPEDTYLTDYNFREGRLEISGLSPSASKLIPLLEASPYFEEASFASAIISQGQELERFKIRLKIERNRNG